MTASTLDAEVIDRQEFITRRFSYRPGQHVSFFGPTGDGKSTLAFQLLDEVATPDLQVVNLVVKPRDPDVLQLSNDAGFKLVHEWPPSRVPQLFAEKPRGWTLWPKHKLTDLTATNANLYRQMIAALKESYASRNGRIVFSDEVTGIIELDAPARGNETTKQWVEAIYTRGRSMNTGQWAATQQPTYVPRKMYSQASHIFLSPDPDEDARKRYSEIGGIDKKLLLHNLERCGTYQFVYVGKKTKTQPTVICIVGA